MTQDTSTSISGRLALADLRATVNSVLSPGRRGQLKIPSSAQSVSASTIWRWWLLTSLASSCAVGKSRRIKIEEVEDEWQKQGWLPDTLEHGGIESYVATPKGDYAKDKVILVLMDAFGLGLVNNKVIVAKSIILCRTLLNCSYSSSLMGLLQTDSK